MSGETTAQVATGAGGAAAGRPVLEAVHVTKHFPVRGGLPRRGATRKVVHAVEDVSLSLYAGRITALVGESGSGKSTLARLLAQLYPVTGGEVRLHGRSVRALRGKAFRDHVRQVQLILQDPFASFNPVATIAGTLRRAVALHHPGKRGRERTAVIDDLLTQINLVPPRQFTAKYPHELSGGQLQRISIARALAADPEVFLADEPVSSLDVSIRLGILNLLRRLTEERNAAMLYVTHDIASARYFATDTAVMYAGQVVESGPSEAVTQQAAHPYTQLLIASAPDPSRASADRVKDIGQPPSLIDPPAGCRFHPRCPYAMERCKVDTPASFDISPGHTARCWLYADDEEARARRAENAEAVATLTAPVSLDIPAPPDSPVTPDSPVAPDTSTD
ncbi:peptide/nickel transport system ATP-binding protein [Actinacidiphila yanglinensis]|uniref:Peptide/nickel transport system ATP-binding protein n=1 Tax=Actinacidiphila yanglinensis TaxID=310779 RepID=A0A1H6E222_9ACTN|nr:ABC transporter ATP-binding protein [Actinacidiphila yanglinensis]SEG91607.1 peptide/nickel transport system ATP-binding protein [Actinacidiphila yanglinensis]